LQHAHTKELHLRFSLGRWDAANWGQMPWNGAREGGTGVELWAWIDADTEEQYASFNVLFLLANVHQGILALVDPDKCLVWPFLRISELH
jgi:phosphatidylinositol glycan class T